MCGLKQQPFLELTILQISNKGRYGWVALVAAAWLPHENVVSCMLTQFCSHGMTGMQE